MSNSDIKVVISQKGTIPVYTTTRIGNEMASWGNIGGNIQDQTDLINYIKSQTETFVFEMATLATEWNIVHNLNKHPTVVMVDSAGTVVEGEVAYIDQNTCTIHTNFPFKGTAYLN